MRTDSHIYIRTKSLEKPEAALSLQRKDSLLTPPVIREIITRALWRAFRVHEELGEDGKLPVEKNQFGDTALCADIGSEKAILDFFTEIGLPIRVISEEHGTVNIGDDPRYLAVLDGLDGSGVYKKSAAGDRSNRYGTMLGLFDNVDPHYRDALGGGIMEHPTRRLFVASKGEGAFTISGENRRPQRIYCSQQIELTPDSFLYVNEDTLFPDNQLLALRLRKAGFNPQWSGSTAHYFADVANGSAVAAVEQTRKGNLEMAAAYRLIIEARGKMFIYIDGGLKELGSKSYLEFGQGADERITIIAAANTKIALALKSFIRT